MIRKPLFPELTGEALRQALIDNAYKMEQEATIERSLTDAQRETYKNRMITIQTRDVEIEQHVEEYIAPLRAERKDIRKETKDIAKTMKKGFVESREPVYHFQNHEAREIETYDANGAFIRSRKMRPEERQTSTVIDMNTKTGTNE